MAEDERKVEPTPEHPGVEEARAEFKGPAVPRDEVMGAARKIMGRYAVALRELAK